MFLALTFGVLVGAPGLALAQESVGSITEGTGEIIVSRASGGEEFGEVGTQVFQHDEIFVGPGGEATITFVDNTILSLGAQSALTIDELVYRSRGPG